MTFTVIDDPGYRMSPSFSRKKGICGTYRNIRRSFPRMSSAGAASAEAEALSCAGRRECS